MGPSRSGQREKDGETLKLNLKSLFFNADRRLRNGWWILAFLGFIALTRLAYKPLTQGLRGLGLGELGLEPVPFVLTLLATWAWAAPGNRCRVSVSGWIDGGSGRSPGGSSWARARRSRSSARSGASAACDSNWTRRAVPARCFAGFYAFLFVALLEENLFRGFLFQRLVDGVGARGAQIALASLFALGHWGSPGMVGSTRVVAALDLFLGAWLLGLAYLRTRSLALPVGLHLGWNWTQGHVLGFGVSGYEQAGWWRPIFQGRAEWLTGGAFGAEASILSPLVSLFLIVLLWRWKGSAGAPAAA